MEYTSQKINYEKLQENVKQNGFSERAKKTISSILLATQMLGVMPNIPQAQNIQDEKQIMMQDNQVTKTQNVMQDNQNNMFNEDIAKNINNFGDRGNINRENLSEFKERSYDVRSKEYTEAWKDNQVIKYEGSIFDISKDFIKNAQDDGIKFFAHHDPDNPEMEDSTRLHTPEELMQIQDFYNKHFSDIKNNKNLSEKEKVIAATMKLSSLVTYDYQAVAKGPDRKPTEYRKAAGATSRNQYGFVKYGTGVCVSYAESMRYIGDMLGVDIKSVGVLSENVYNNLTDKDKKFLMEDMGSGKDLLKSNHRVNIVNFSDGTTCMLDVTNHDACLEKGLYKKGAYSQSNFFFTDAKNFKGAKYINGMSCLANSQHREATAKSVQLSPAELEAAEKKILQEVPSIRLYQAMDEYQRENKFTYKETGNRFHAAHQAVQQFFTKTAGLWNNFTSKFSKNEQQQLLAATRENLGINELNENVATTSINTLNENTIGNKESEVQLNGKANFMDMLSNNGQYRKAVEECTKAYQSKQNDVAQKSSEEHEL